MHRWQPPLLGQATLTAPQASREVNLAFEAGVLSDVEGASDGSGTSQSDAELPYSSVLSHLRFCHRLL